MQKLTKNLKLALAVPELVKIFSVKEQEDLIPLIAKFILGSDPEHIICYAQIFSKIYFRMKSNDLKIKLDQSVFIKQKSVDAYIKFYSAFHKLVGNDLLTILNEKFSK